MKTKLLVLLLTLLQSGGLLAQNLYATNTGETSFFSETPAENIKAINKNGQAIINTMTGEVVVQMNMKQFDFPNKLMQEHFNENYIESDKFPKAIFKGKINEKIDYTKDGAFDISATGDFTVHGITKPRTLKGTITISPNNIGISTNFEVALTDHNITIPKIVFVKIAQVIKVSNKYTLTPYVPKK